MNRNKLIAVGLILTLGVFLAAGCTGGEETPEEETEEEPEDNITGEAEGKVTENTKILESEMTSKPGAEINPVKVTGVVKNVGNKRIDTIDIKVKLYNKEGKEISKGTTDVEALKVGNKEEFTVDYFSKIDSEDIDKIDDYEITTNVTY